MRLRLTEKSYRIRSGYHNNVGESVRVQVDATFVVVGGPEYMTRDRVSLFTPEDPAKQQNLGAFYHNHF